MRNKSGFRVAVRRGHRSGTRRVVVHLLRRVDSGESPCVGFVVGRSVGRAVTRNRVRRRLRHLVRERLGRLPLGSLVVVRANASAANARYGKLEDDLDRALGRVLRTAGVFPEDDTPDEGRE